METQYIIWSKLKQQLAYKSRSVRLYTEWIVVQFWLLLRIRWIVIIDNRYIYKKMLSEGY